jgi:hypothetical protein
MRERWEGDTRGEGVASAAAFAGGVVELAQAAREEAWVAEEPELHLLPHLERACEASPLELVSTATSPDGVFEVELRWQGPPAGVGRRREAVFSLVGAISEGATYIRQVAEGDSLRFDVVTGLLAPDTTFAPHGHALRLHVR